MYKEDVLKAAELFAHMKTLEDLWGVIDKKEKEGGFLALCEKSAGLEPKPSFVFNSSPSKETTLVDKYVPITTLPSSAICSCIKQYISDELTTIKSHLELLGVNLDGNTAPASVL